MHADYSIQAWTADIRAALGLLTRIPVGFPKDSRPEDLARAARLYPLVGLLVGLLGGAVFWLAHWLGLPAVIAALLALAATILVTGALHEDGLSDVADGFGGAFARDRKLEIMRDPRTGTFGALALILSVGLRTAALATLATPAAAAAGLVAAHSASRAALPAVMALLPLARASGLAGQTGKPGLDQAAIAVVLALIIVVLAVGIGQGLAVAILVAIWAACVALLARAQIGGYTGDVLGAVQQICEIAVLLALVATR